MSSGNLKYWELSLGGSDGGITIDASSATAIATGLRAVAIDVRSACAFSVLTGNVNNVIGTAINFRVDSGLTGITIEPGMLYSGYGRYFSDIQITAGQITYYSRADD